MEDNIVSTSSPLQNDLDTLNEHISKVKTEVGKLVVGQEKTIDLIMAGIFTGGHILLEGVPGIAKTLTAKLLARTLSVDFSRIQFTPDLMPTDVVGTSVFNLKTSEFTFNRGPIFGNIVLVDEINRAPAKTQSALFEVMEERQITVDGTTYTLEFPFVIIATQNPIEQEGTYRLPEAQLDRFLFRIKLNYLTVEQETEVLKRFRDDFTMKAMSSVEAVLSKSDMSRCQQIIEKIHIKDEILSYIAQVVASTRSHS
ncbi:MAG TPA: AAA family ATPase, partial [Cyclobacteriaceae bacterium]|nr:AAA family ATPase [Cyclobacteriaceae bacterium]